MSIERLPLGKVSAYADAKDHGYKGTREEFGEYLARAAEAAEETVHAHDEVMEAAAQVAQDATNTAEAAEEATAAKGTAVQAAETALEARNVAKQYSDNADSAKDSAGLSAERARSSATAAEESAGRAEDSAEAASGSATTAGQKAEAASESATNAQKSASDAEETLEEIKTVGATQVENIRTEGAAQVSAIQTKGEETRASIPSDYTSLSDDVNHLKSDIDHGLIGKNLVGTEVGKYYRTYIPKGSTVTWSYANGGVLVSQSAYFYFYDINKTQLTYYGITANAGRTSRTVTLPNTEDIYYIRITGTPTDNVMMVLGSSTAEYVPYIPKTTELQDDIDIIASMIHSEVSIELTAGSSHSSVKDKCPLAVKSGEEYYFYVSTENSFTPEIYEYNKSSDTSIGRYKVNTFYKKVASSDITHISAFISAQSVDTKATLYAFRAKSLDGIITDRLLAVETEAEDVKGVLDGFGHVTFSVGANKTHSSAANRINIDIVEGEEFYVIVGGFGKRTASVFLSDSSALAYSVNDGIVNKFKANATTTFVGVFVGSGSEDVVVNVTVLTTNSAFADLLSLSNYDRDFKIKLANANRKANTYNYSQLTSPEIFTLAHFSDIHGNTFAIKQMQMFKDKFKDYIDDMICTGDVVVDKLSDGTDFWSANSDGGILICIGNHDSLGADGWSNPVSQQVLYDTYISPYESNWNASTVSGHSYWYKDYPNKKVRLISVDGTIFDSTEQEAQMTWLRSALNDAKTNDYAVIGAVHFPPVSSTFQKIECNFSSLLHTTAGDMAQFAWNVYNGDILQAVDDFIDDGGDFVCWLSGHTHYDNISYDTRFPRQLFVTISCAMPSGQFDERVRSSGYYLPGILLNTISVDTVRKYIKIIRYGAEWDDCLRHTGSCVIKYDANPPQVMFQN